MSIVKRQIGIFCNLKPEVPEETRPIPVLFFDTKFDRSRYKYRYLIFDDTDTSINL